MDIITRVNWVDLLALIIILRISYVAFNEGLSHEIFPLTGGIVVVVLSLHYYTKLGQFIWSNIPAIPVEIANLIGGKKKRDLNDKHNSSR